MAGADRKTLVIRNSTLIDGLGRPPVESDCLMIEGTRIRSVGPLPAGIELRDSKSVRVIDAAGQWIMPGLIDAHVHLSYGYSPVPGEGKGRGTTRPEFGGRRAARRPCCAPA